MAPVFRDGSKLPQKALDLIVRRFHMVAKPMYLGEVSMVVSWSLSRTQEMLDELERLGTVRQLSLEEKLKGRFVADGNVYCLVESPKLSKAHF